MLKTAGELGYAVPTLAAIREVLVSAVEEGFGEGDLSGLIRLFEGWAGVEVKAS